MIFMALCERHRGEMERQGDPPTVLSLELVTEGLMVQWVKLGISATYIS